jgi:hypothetical protein
MSPTFRGPKFEIFSEGQSLTFKSQNGDLKSIFKFWEENLQDYHKPPALLNNPSHPPALPHEYKFSQ